MLASWPELVLRTMMARRDWHQANGHGVLRLIAPRGSRRAFEVRDLLERNNKNPQIERCIQETEDCHVKPLFSVWQSVTLHNARVSEKDNSGQ